ncbi:MAG: hypothetical protein HYU33_06075 [Candidatus Omnitrophica bacterium]|nr:hypothetical protein [Candidatus Omnitrophota bacterium]
MTIDLRFIEIGYEFHVLRESIRLLEEHLPMVVSTEIARLREAVDPDDEASLSEVSFRESELEQGVVTRAVTGAPVIAAWAGYEAAVTKLARSIQKCRSIRLGLSDLRGSFLDRARKYFADVLAFELHPQGTDWGRLEMIATVRHCLAHANGRFPDIKGKDQQRVLDFARITSELRLEGEYIVVTLPFARSAVEFIDSLLSELVERTRATFPHAKDVD